MDGGLDPQRPQSSILVMNTGGLFAGSGRQHIYPPPAWYVGALRFKV